MTGASFNRRLVMNVQSNCPSQSTCSHQTDQGPKLMSVFIYSCLQARARRRRAQASWGVERTRLRLRLAPPQLVLGPEHLVLDLWVFWLPTSRKLQLSLFLCRAQLIIVISPSRLLLVFFRLLSLLVRAGWRRGARRGVPQEWVISSPPIT